MGQILNWGQAPENSATLTFIAAAAVVLILSFLCSIYESVLLSITRPQIEKLMRQGQHPASEVQGQHRLHL